MSKNINNEPRKIYLGDAVLYNDKTYYLDEKNGEIGIVNFESGAWGRDFPFIPLSKIDMNKITDMMGRNIEIVNQKFKEGGGVSSDNAEKIAKLQKVVDSAMIPDAVKEKARIEIEKLRSEEGKDKSEKVEQKGLSAEQREINKKALALITKNKFDSQKVIQGIVHLSLEDANYHSAAFEFAKLVDSNIKTKQDWYRTETFKITKKQREVAIEISQMCGWEGEKIVAAYEFVLKMLGFHQLFDKLKEAMEDDSNEGNYPNAIEELTKNQILYADTIAGRTALTKEIVQDFIKRNGLNEKETLNLVQGVGMGKVSGADFMTAVIGLPNNEFEEKIVAFAKSNEAFKTEPKKTEAPIVKDDRVKGRNISDISTYISHRAIESIVVTHAGKKVTLKGSDIFDGIYVENKVLGIKDKTKKQPNVARTQFEEETFEFGDGGSIVENKLMKLKEEGKLKTLVNVNGQKYFQTIIPNKQEKGYWKRYYSLNQNNLGKMQNAMLSEDDLKNLFEQQQNKMALGGNVDKMTTKEVEDEYNKILSIQIMAGDIDEDEVEDLTIAEKREFLKEYFQNNYAKGGYLIQYDPSKKKTIVNSRKEADDFIKVLKEKGHTSIKVMSINQYKDKIELERTEIKSYLENQFKIKPIEYALMLNKKGNWKISPTNVMDWMKKYGSIQDIEKKVNKIFVHQFGDGGNADKIGFDKAEVEKLTDEYSNIYLYKNNKLVYKGTIPNSQANNFKLKYNKITSIKMALGGNVDKMTAKEVEDEYNKILSIQIMAGDIDEDEVEDLTIAEKREFLKEYFQNNYAKGGYTRPGMDIPTRGSYEFKTNEGLVYEIDVVGFERQGDDTDSLYFDDSNSSAKRQLGAITIKNNAWKKLSKGQTITAVSSTGIKGKLTRMKKFELGGTVQEEIDYIDNRIYNLEQLKQVANDDEQDYFESQIKSLEKEKADLMNKSDKPAKKGWFFKNGGLTRHEIENKIEGLKLRIAKTKKQISTYETTNRGKYNKLFQEKVVPLQKDLDNLSELWGKAKYENGGQTPAQKKKIEKVMHEFKTGTLKSSSGDKVTDRDQAIAIALSEAGLSKRMEEGGSIEIDSKKIGIAKRTKIKNWYIKSYPNDDLGEEINGEISFWTLYVLMYQGNEVYSLLEVNDSIVRERVFEKLSEILGVDYDYIYKLWLRADKYSKGGWVLYDEDSEKLIKTFETESEARKSLYEYSGNGNIVKKENWENTDSKNMKAKGGWSHKK